MSLLEHQMEPGFDSNLADCLCTLEFSKSNLLMVAFKYHLVSYNDSVRCLRIEGSPPIPYVSLIRRPKKVNKQKRQAGTPRADQVLVR